VGLVPHQGLGQRTTATAAWRSSRHAAGRLGAADAGVILGGIYGGIFTPTEASVVAVFYALIVGMVIHREIKLRDLCRCCASR
jgi:TRAP-type C4-dicarboxylate transport system permease large subunit